MRPTLKILSALLILCVHGNAQVSISDDPDPPDPSAMLDIRSVNKGILTPRMTYTEMGLIPNPASGLTVFCTTHGQYYINRGTPAAPEWVSTVSLPFLGFLTTNQPIFSVTNYGLGYGGIFVIDNPSSYASAVYASTNGPGWTIAGFNTGTTDGFAGYFRNTSPTNTWPAIQGKTAGPAPVFRAYQTNGPGGGLDVFMLYESSTAPGIAVEQHALGNACYFINLNAANSSSLLHSENNGTGDVGYFQTNAASGSNAAVKGRATGAGGLGGAFEIWNSDNPNNAMYAHTSGTGRAGNFYIDNGSNNAASLWAGTNGTGSAGNFYIENGSNSSPAIWAGTAGAGSAGAFEITNSSNSWPAVWSKTVGTGNAASFNIENPASGAPAVQATTNGTGTAGDFSVNNESSAASALYTTSNAHGPTFYSQNTGPGNGVAGFFNITNASNTYPAVQAESAGTGPAFRAIQWVSTAGPGLDIVMNNASMAAAGIQVSHQGLGNAGSFYIGNPSNSQPTVMAGTNSSIGHAGKFANFNSGNNGAALFAETNGPGASFLANHTGSSGSIAVFQSGGTNKARIDKTGKGFFNGGTQTGGADVAELFDVEGEVTEYEPGDVLVISASSDRRMEKSTSSVSTRVAGVYATKPGVILTERGMDEDQTDLVPVGMMGVIPTKVCTENGPIRRGDLLVTSSKPGHAMKAIPVEIKGMQVYPTGAILGKALENFESGGSGLINVLVNVK